MQSNRRSALVAVDSSDEQAAPTGSGRWIRYDVRELDDGVYVGLSIGPADVPIETYFTVEGGEVRRELGPDRRRAERELRRQP